MKISNLRKIYGKQIILNDISVEASKGQIIGLVGNNGSGKTTLLKCISNLIVDYQGEIELDGKLAFSIESPTFYDDLTVFSNLKLFSELAGSKKVNIEEVLKQVKLKDAKNKKFKQLSLGMKQKLSIARILLDNADIILLDEPFNGLDILTKEQLKELMIMLRSKGKLLIVSSHILEELGEISDVIWYLREGNIQSIINLHDDNRVYKIVVSKNSVVRKMLQENYHARWCFDKDQNSIFKIEILKKDIYTTLKSLINDNVLVIEFTDVTTDIRELMVEEG